MDYDAVNASEESQEEVLSTKLPKRQRKVLLAAADVYRPAAIKQLEILGESINVDVFTKGTDADPVDIAAEALEKAKTEGYDTVLIDTAGRQVIDADLMNELRRIKERGVLCLYRSFLTTYHTILQEPDNLCVKRYYFGREQWNRMKHCLSLML